MQILEEQHQLSFHLQQQRLIELIRQGKTEEALEHAQEYLAPPGEEDPAFLEELGECLNAPHSQMLPAGNTNKSLNHDLYLVYLC